MFNHSCQLWGVGICICETFLLSATGSISRCGSCHKNSSFPNHVCFLPNSRASFFTGSFHSLLQRICFGIYFDPYLCATHCFEVCPTERKNISFRWHSLQSFGYSKVYSCNKERDWSIRFYLANCNFNSMGFPLHSMGKQLNQQILLSFDFKHYKYTHSCCWHISHFYLHFQWWIISTFGTNISLSEWNKH